MSPRNEIILEKVLKGVTKSDKQMTIMVKMSKVIPEGYKFNFYIFQGEIFVIFNNFFFLLDLSYF